MYEDNESSVEEDDFSDYDYVCVSFPPSHNREDMKRGKGHSSGSIHLHYSKSKRFIDLVTAKAVSRLFSTP